MATTTLQEPARAMRIKLDASASTKKIDLSAYAKMSNEQLGHIRHIHNLATQPDNSWNHMGGEEPIQEWFDAYRYQLATMTYAASVAHYHRQPILRSVYKPLVRSLIHKMLLRSVWSYWFNTSMGGTILDPDLTELRKPWADPVVRENIMYSGHLLLMTALYGMLFGDDEFEQPDSIVFNWNPMFFGFGPERFSYSNQTLQEAIIREIARTGYLGACCEPNAVFIVCNQFPIIGIRYRDVRNGTNVVDDVLAKYRAAWEKEGMTGTNGLLAGFYMVRQKRKMDAPDGVTGTAWTGAFMNTWNSEFVRSGFEKQLIGHITTFDGEVRLQTPEVAREFRKLVSEGGAAPDAVDTLIQAKHRATEAAKTSNVPIFYVTPMLGYVVQWLSELGKTDLLDGLLKYADQHLNRDWEKGGLFYRRSDRSYDEDWNWTGMEPYTGNAAIGYARLNVEDGQKKMYEQPWTKSDLASRPWVDGVQLADDVDFVRGVWDESRKLILLTMRTWNGERRMVRPTFKNLTPGLWQVYVDGELRASSQGEDVRVEVVVGKEDVDVVAVKSEA